MDCKFVKRSFFQRVFGVSETKKPTVANCWEYEDGKLVINLHEASELRTPGGAIRFEGGNLPVRVLVVCGEGGEYRAYRNQCTHFGHRRLDPVPGTNTVQCCSINKSTFDSSGNTIFGPAPHSIHCYPVEKDQEKLIVLISE
ncbi:MAG: Rieske 2Fe-2S domain-containing protein [Proteobacteria bacterium]|nr:Rieske 2Fe-2S domain-containing protein [Pseudomonadota bacterium]MBU1057347.1 Rieske 2Fe-2S domain-containing protein [Pseudomonadota bacterium]